MRHRTRRRVSAVGAVRGGRARSACAAGGGCSRVPLVRPRGGRGRLPEPGRGHRAGRHGEAHPVSDPCRHWGAAVVGRASERIGRSREGAAGSADRAVARREAYAAFHYQTTTGSGATFVPLVPGGDHQPVFWTASGPEGRSTSLAGGTDPDHVSRRTASRCRVRRRVRCCLLWCTVRA